MQNLKTIENLLVDLNTQDFEQLQELIKKQIANNRISLNKAITEGNIEAIDLFIDKVNFDDTYISHLKKQVVPHIKSLHYLSQKNFTQSFSITDLDTLNAFHLLFKDILDLGEFNDFYKKNHTEKTKFSLSDVLFASLFHRLKLNFEYSGEEPYPKYVFIKSLVGKNEKVWNEILNNFCNSSLSGINFQDNSLLIAELLKAGFKDKLFQQAKNNDNYSYLKTLVDFDNIYNDNFMLSGLSSYHFPMVKESFEHGVPFFKSDETLTQEQKAQYKNVFSSVFASKESLDIQEFIIDNIDNISVGNHIIAKTILHKLEDTYETDFERNDKRIALINKILERYSELENEDILNFQKILQKRKDSYAKNLFEKFINYHLLNQKFPSTSVTIKKNKI